MHMQIWIKKNKIKVRNGRLWMDGLHPLKFALI